MLHLIIAVSRIALVLLMAYYTYSSFAALRSTNDEEDSAFFYMRQTVCMYLIILIGNTILYINTFENKILFMTAIELTFMFAVGLIYKQIYIGASVAVTNNLCMLLGISFIILTRLNIDKAYKQLLIAAVALAISCLVPFLINKLKFLDQLTYAYAAVGILSLGIVAVMGITSYGAKLSFTIAGITVQPSEFIKIIFVFFVASILYNAKGDFIQLRNATIIAGIHVLILIASKDLGGAGIFLITYLVMVYVATKQPLYIIGGFAFGAVGMVGAYFLFGHVQNRVAAWLDPIGTYETSGYQISHSLFAIGTGGWFGSGLYQGMPEKIPVVEKDMTFAAISEELGAVFAICLIFICISCFLMFFNIAMQIKDPFYKLIAVGLGCEYGVQVFLTIGGVTKFIPSTGVTLPLVSYGGSSLLSTMILFAIIQGLYVLREEGEE